MGINRRRALIGLGALAAGGSAFAGTGAFTSVQADRTMTVATANDADAFLALDTIDSPNSAEFAEITDGTLEIDIGDTDDGGSGVNLNAITHIDRVFKITNQGTRPLMFKMNYFLSNTGWIQNAGQGQSHLNFEVFGDGQSMSRDFPDQRGYNQDHSLGNPSGGGFGDASSRGTGYRFDPGDEYYMIVSIDTTGPNASKTDDLTGTAVLEPAVVTTQNSWEPENPPSV